MSIPLSFFLVIYLILAPLFLLYAVFNIWHVVRFGEFDSASYFMTGLFIAGLVLISFVSFTFISRVDWSQRIELFNLGTTQIIPETQF
jgi:hypothetical protein